MKKIFSEIEKLELSTREYFLAGIIIFLIGLVTGIAMSPKGDRSYGSNNGNNNGNNNQGCLTEEIDDSCDED